LTIAQAAQYLSLSEGHLLERADIPRVNVASPESHKPAWRFRVADLEAFARLRLVNPYRTKKDEESDGHAPSSGVQ
jgi:hypothetical protein